MEAKKIKISALRLNDGNPRIIKDHKFHKLVKSILTFPEMLSLREIVADEAMMVLGGNMRLRAMLHIAQMTEQELSQTLRQYGAERHTDYWLAWHDQPMAEVKVAEGLSDEQKKEFIVKDNVGYGEWDWDMLANEWDVEDLNDWGVDLPIDWGNGIDSENADLNAEEDDFDEEKDEVEPVCKRGDIWMLGQHTLMCGDSTSEDDINTLMGGVKADMWITDPPYNVAVSNAQGKTIMNDNMDKKSFREFLTSAFRQACNVLSKGCPFYVWFASSEHLNFEGALNDVGLKVRQELIWNKNQFILGRSHYQWKHEPCLYGWKGDSCKHFTDQRNHASVIEDSKEIDIKKMKASEMRELLFKIFDDKVSTTVLDENKPAKDAEHPTMKPIKLFGRLIMNSSRQKDKVLDTFGGSGTTLIACEQLDRKCYMMELDPHYCDVIIARWEKLTGNKATKIERL